MSPTMARSRDPEKDDRSKEEMAVAADAAALVDGKGGAGVGQAELELQGGWVWVGRKQKRNRLEPVLGGTELWSQCRARVHGEPGICQE